MKKQEINIIDSIKQPEVKAPDVYKRQLKDLLGGTIQEMMEAELDEHLGCDEYERSDNPDYRNGVKPVSYTHLDVYKRQG